jgi:hypothetical protein
MLARGVPDPLLHPTTAPFLAWHLHIHCVGCEESSAESRRIATIQRAGSMNQPFSRVADIQNVELKGKAGLIIACRACANAGREDYAKWLEWSEIKALLDNLEAAGPGTPPLTVTV